MRNLGYCQYTYRHRKAFKYVVEKIIKDKAVKEEMLRRAEVHDLDKMTLYLFLPKQFCSDYHRHTASHHMGNSETKEYYDMLEAVIDYECAAYTKPDKPLNAYDTINKLRTKYSDSVYNGLMSILREYNMDSSYTVLDDKKGLEYMKQFETVTEEMILEEVLTYVSNNPNNSFILNRNTILESL